MGRVFSSEQILSGDFPRPVDFEVAIQAFETGVNDGVQRGLFDGGTIYGSVAVGTQTVRSDFDCMIALTGCDDPIERSAARQSLIAIHDETGGRVPIEKPLVEPVSFLSSGRHELDRCMMQTLVGPDRIVFGHDPASYLCADHTISASSILSSYITHKIRKMRDAYNAINPLDPRENGLQRQLELPVALARKALQTLSETPSFTDEFRAVDKLTIIKLGQRLFEQHGIDQTFNSLVNLDKDYTDILHSFIDGKVEAGEYDNFLREMHAHLPQTIAWLKAVGETVLPMFVHQQ
jgi:hypothetical protein